MRIGVDAFPGLRGSVAVPELLQWTAVAFVVSVILFLGSDEIDIGTAATMERGELLPRFQQAPMVASFMQEPEPGVAQRQAIPVPKGPVDVW